jgi:hypothetical protein
VNWMFIILDYAKNVTPPIFKWENETSEILLVKKTFGLAQLQSLSTWNGWSLIQLFYHWSWMTFILEGYPMFFKQPKFSWNHGSLAKRPKFQKEPWSLKQMLPNYQGNIVPMRNGPKFIINHASRGNGSIAFKNHVSLRQMDPSFSRNHGL